MLDDLHDRLRRALGPIPADPMEAAGALAEEALAGPSSPGALSPWAAWLAVGLIRHLPRQLLIGDAIREQLGEDDGAGLVAGWHFTVEEQRCFAYSESGGTIAFDGSAEHVTPIDYLTYLESLPQPEPPEARILALHPDREQILLAFDELQEAGIASAPEDDLSCRLTPGARACEGDVRAFVARWEDPRAVPWLGAHLGDWSLAAELSPGDARIRRAAERTVAERVRSLERRLDARAIGPFALRALARIAPAERLRRYVRAAIEGPPDGLTRAAVELMERDEDADFGPEMMDVFTRVSLVSHRDLVAAAGRYLLERGHDPGVMMPRLLEIANIPDEGPMCGNTSVTEIMLIALEHAPGEALPVVRRGLRSLLASARVRTSAVLALLGGAWAERELLAALRESTDGSVTAPYRVALRMCGGPDACAEVERWEAAHERPAMRDARRSFSQACIATEIDTFKDRVQRIRSALPADFGEA